VTSSSWVAPPGILPVFLTGICKRRESLKITTALTRSVDTADVAFEIEKRGKKRSDFIGFRNNSLKWFEYTLKQNSCHRTFCVQSDVQRYEFRRPVSFCLLDVDLYQPTISALRKVWPMLSPGGMIVVDDCKPANQFDGAMQAYTDFTESQGLPSRHLLDKLGIVTKQ